MNGCSFHYLEKFLASGFSADVNLDAAQTAASSSCDRARALFLKPQLDKNGDQMRAVIDAGDETQQPKNDV